MKSQGGKEMRKACVSVVVMVSVMSAGSVFAQAGRVNPSIPFTGGDATHISLPYEPAMPPNSVAMPPVERARYTLNAYASCLVHFNRRDVETTLALPVGTKASQQAEVKLAIDDCMADGELTMDGALLRGALYRALYRIDFPKSSPPLAVQPIDYARDMAPAPIPRNSWRCINMPSAWHGQIPRILVLF
jgi:hypothetical protein